MFHGPLLIILIILEGEACFSHIDSLSPSVSFLLGMGLPRRHTGSYTNGRCQKYLPLFLFFWVGVSMSQNHLKIGVSVLISSKSVDIRGVKVFLVSEVCDFGESQRLRILIL
jgi:hypothetical protein